MVMRMITHKGVQVRPKNRFELYASMFMRLSGLVLIFMAVFHFLYMHFYIQVDTINFAVIAFRWRSLFWRVYDFLLLAFGFTHGMNGLRVVLEDYLPKGLWQNLGRAVVLVVYLALILMGAGIIFTFQAP